MKSLQIIFCVLLILFWGCTSKMVVQKKSDFNFDVCNATYKGKPLPFDKPLSEWIKIFGKYDRLINEHNYVWDSLGIYLRKSNFTKNGTLKGTEEPDYIRICFVNLNSPIGQSGKLEFGSKYQTIFGKILRRSENNNYYVYVENEPLIPIGDDSLKYQYPLKTYNDTVIVDGGIITRNMSLKEVNNNRIAINGNRKYGYWDKDFDWKDERGSTSVKSGQFAVLGKEGEKSKCGIEKEFYYLTTLRYTEGVLEYIKIEKVEKGKSMYWD